MEKLINIANAKTFILAGNATFTLRSVKTGTRYTFKVTRSDKGKGNVWFVSLLTGPCNESDYNYLGLVSGVEFKLTKASKLPITAAPVAAFKWFFDHVMGNTVPVNVEIFHAGKCCRCGRKLTVPESIESGIGPECAGKMGFPLVQGKLPYSQEKADFFAPAVAAGLSDTPGYCSTHDVKLPCDLCDGNAYGAYEAKQEQAAFMARMERGL